MSTITIIIAQTDFILCDIAHNSQMVLENVEKAKAAHNADIILFPELTLTGYLPEDRLMRQDEQAEVKKGLDALVSQLHGTDVVLGYPEAEDGVVYNAACVVRDGKIIANYRKQLRPNYRVFDEKRFFGKGSEPCIFDCKGRKFGVVICEDAWHEGPAEQSKAAGTECLLSLNASPFYINKAALRETVLAKRARATHLPLIYAHWNAGQDEIIFDGGSFAMNPNGEIAVQSPFLENTLTVVEVESKNDRLAIKPQALPEVLSETESAYRALIQGIKGYTSKNGFPGVLIGLSGGIDSALTLTLAADALGAENVHALMMPSQYNSDISLEDAIQLTKNLGVSYDIISIQETYDLFLKTLKPTLGELNTDVTAQNIQARIRGSLLMAHSNKTGKLVLTTGNKSELAMGYATLYGDMAGGYAVLKDVYKTLVYALSRYRNEVSPVIPERIITRAPSAELAPDQVDEDSLPPYDILDQILARYIEQDQGAAEITAAGFDREMVISVLNSVDRNEYKRYQAPPGIKITPRSFGKDRRYPLTKQIWHG